MSSFTKIYWRSSGVPTWGLIFLIVLSVIVMVSAENIKQRDPVVDDNYATMVNASKIMREGMQVLKPLRAKLAPINPEFDPQRSGMVGLENSIVTTNHGSRESKQTTVNPNWAAVAVKLMADAGVQLTLYPLSAFRAMSAAAENVYQTLRNEGTQKNIIDTMQPRSALYEILGYHKYEQKLDELLARTKNTDTLKH